MKTNVDVAIIGGGVTGAAVAYSLAAAGRRDVLLLERNAPAGGATAKAAALVSLARSFAPIIPFVRETCRQIRELSEGRPEALGYFQVGAVHAASSAGGVEVLDKTFAASREGGVAGGEIAPAEARARLPWIAEASLAKAYFYGEDGFVDAYLLTTAYLEAAKRMGATVAVGREVKEIIPSPAGGYALRTAAGNIGAETVVLAGGAWSNLLLDPLDSSLPLAPVRSQYWITGYNPLLFPAQQPVCILPDARAYTRPENGSLIVGWREPDCVWIDPHAIPRDVFSYRFRQDPDGWDNLEGCAESIGPHFPEFGEQGIAQYIAGFSTYTPDGLFNVGAVAGLPGMYAAAGCAGMGVAVCGGIGRALADLICRGKTDLPMEAFSPDRFGKTDALTTPFMQRCADARSGKKTG